MDARPLEQQCWHCGLALGTAAHQACPSCGTPLRPPGDTLGPHPATTARDSPPTEAPPASSALTAAAAPADNAERLERDPLLTPWLRTALWAVLIIVLLAGAGVMAGRVVGS